MSLPTLRQNLKHLREKNGYSQEGLCKRIGVNRSMAAHWEKGNSIPQTETLALLAQLYDTSINDLVRKDLTQKLVD